MICEYRLTYMKLVVEHLHPDCIVSHDDWEQKTACLCRRRYGESSLGANRDFMIIFIHRSNCNASCIPISGAYC